MVTYDPKSALRAFRHHKVGLPKPQDQYTIKPRPQLLCVLLTDFSKRAPSLPDDLQALERTGTAIKDHVRGDGGVFLGSYELPHTPSSVVLVWGDPLLDPSAVIRATHQFRRDLATVERARGV